MVVHMSEIVYFTSGLHAYNFTFCCLYLLSSLKQKVKDEFQENPFMLFASYRPYATCSLHVEIMVPMVFLFGSNNGIFIYFKAS